MPRKKFTAERITKELICNDLIIKSHTKEEIDLCLDIINKIEEGFLVYHIIDNGMDYILFFEPEEWKKEKRGKNQEKISQNQRKSPKKKV